MFRFLLIAFVCAAAAAVIEPSWNSEGRALVLRLRSGGELTDFVRAQSRALGRRAAEALEERLGSDEAGVESTPPVGAALRSSPPLTAEPIEGITPGEQRQLDRLVEEATREP